MTTAILLALCLPVPGRAATTAEACVAIADDARRLACYDTALGRVQTAAGPVARSATAEAVEPESQFGMSPQMKLESQGRTELQSITAKVTKVSYSTPDRRIFTLDNGQVWLQTETTPRLRVSPGDTVTIKRALMGSFLLVTAQTGSTRARRIR